MAVEEERCEACYCCSVCRRGCGCEARLVGETGEEEFEDDMIKRILGIQETAEVHAAEEKVARNVREEIELFEGGNGDESDEESGSSESEAEGMDAPLIV